MPAGRYFVRAFRDGFEDTETTAFHVTAGSTSQVLVEMRLTFVRESVDVVAPANSPTESLQPVAVSDVLTGNKMDVQRVQRGRDMLAATDDLRLLEGDRLVVNDTSAYLKEYERSMRATLYDADRVDKLPPDQHPLLGADQQLVEVVVSEESPLHHRTLREARFGHQTWTPPRRRGRNGCP